MNEKRKPVCGPGGCRSSSLVNAEHVRSQPLENGAMLVLDVYSDTICPWCLIALRRVQQAAAMIDGLYLELRWHAFQLNAEMPLEGIRRRAYRSAKFGSWERSSKLDDQVRTAGEIDGVIFRHDLMQWTPNTTPSHRLIHWAGQVGRQTETVDRLFTAYFCDGLNVGQFDVLTQIASELDLDSVGFANWYNDNGGLDEIAKSQNTAVQLGIRGVPAFLHQGQMLFSGALDAASLVSMFKRLVNPTGSEGVRNV